MPEYINGEQQYIICPDITCNGFMMDNMQACPNFLGKVPTAYCNIIKDITGLPYSPHSNACRACSACSRPQALNPVTLRLCRRLLSIDDPKLIQASKQAYSDSFANLLEINNGIGVGSQLWKLLSELGIEHRSDCSCLDWAVRMNNWGAEGCRLYKKDIINHIKSSSKSYGWGDITKAVTKAISSGLAFRLSITDPFGSLLDEAIRLAEENEVIKKKL